MEQPKKYSTEDELLLSNQFGNPIEDSIILSDKLFVEIAKKRTLIPRSLPLTIPTNQTDIRYNSPPRELIIKKTVKS